MKVTDATGTIATYDYDFEGKRISKTTSSGTINYHYSGQKVVYETDGSGNIVAEYTWDQSGRPVTMVRNGNTYYYHLNGHGDVIKLTDDSGNIVAEYEYDAWGNILTQSGTMAASNPFRYAGYMYDEETGLYYLLTRYYDAEIGRFISRDTLLGDKTLPVSLNQYNYSYNNPVNFVDNIGKYPTNVQTYTNFKVLSRGEADWLNGTTLSDIPDALGVSSTDPATQVITAGGPIFAFLLGLAGANVGSYDNGKFIGAKEGDIAKTYTTIYGTKGESITEYYRKDTGKLYYTRDWGEFDIPAGTLYRIGNPVQNKENEIESYLWRQYLA